MEPSCIRQTQLPHTTKLFADFLYHPERVQPFYPYLPVSEESFRKQAASIRFSPEQRKNLVQALQVQNAGNPLLEKLARPGTVAVVTGQQVGLFSGPAYTIYKALTAIRLASHLDSIGIPAVPVFWLATEDHDFAEVNQAWAFDAEQHAHCFEVKAEPRPNQPVGGIEMQTVPLEALRNAWEGLPYGGEAFEMVRESYQPGATFGGAFGSLLDRLLTGFPLLRVDPMLAEFRALAAPLLREAVLETPALTEQILLRNKALIEAGYHAQVHVENTSSFFFVLQEGARLALRRENGNFAAGKHKFSAADLAGRAQDLSPNALLRPVVQDSMIPTVAYVGGPAELAYLAQSEVLYENLLGRQPIAIHRAGFTLLDTHASKLLDRYRLTLPDFFHGEEQLKERAARTLVDSRLIARISESRGTAVAALEKMAVELRQFDQSTVKALEKSRRKIEYQFERIERKVEREALVRDERASRQVAELNGLLFPRHRLQERLFSGMALIAQHGADLVARLHEQVSLECPDHQVLTI